VEFRPAAGRRDIAGSLAHARMLAATGIIPADDLARIEHGMAQISAEIARGEFVCRATLRMSTSTSSGG